MENNMQGVLEMLCGTGRNSFVIKSPISLKCGQSSVVVNEEEAQKLSFEDIGKKYTYHLKEVQMGISTFILAFNLIEIIEKNPLDALSLEELEILLKAVQNSFGQLRRKIGMQWTLVSGLPDEENYKYMRIYHKAGLYYFTTSNLKDGQLGFRNSMDYENFAHNVKIEIEFRK